MEQKFNIDPNIAYDVVELPSKGIYYANERTSVRVAYLTAADENILSSPNLIAQGKVIDELLKRKIVDKDISPNEIVEEDRQAILIFLRNTSFGTDYKINLKDPKTKEEFTADVDLSTLKIKDFDLKADSNGEYEYFMEKSKKNITFKFLNRLQEDELENIRKGWDDDKIAPISTKRLEMMIKSVEGNRDLMGIHRFVDTLPIKDSQDFKRYVLKNKPGIDLSTEVSTPSGEKINVEVGFGVDFFDLSMEYRKAQLDEILFLINKKFSYSDVLSMPVFLRRYYIEHMLEMAEKNNE